ncbi:hypothetical protein PAHAL_2G412000 [Panicum hallii]|uniref:Uncharacterized protein n=1 Tax=Panicum hallii TaxID=206008 RepID=A0A2T8KSB1_9POAL|nr:hypothetical protein PAHAL_2G412000 [Panicum hallii]
MGGGASPRAGALAARAPPLLLRVNETFRCAGARRDWERLGAGSWTGTGTGGGGRGRAREPTRDSDGRGQRIRGRATGGASPRSHPRRCARQSSQRAPTHAAASARATSAKLPFRPRPRPGFPLGLLAPLLCNTREPSPSRVRASDKRQAALERMRAKRRASDAQRHRRHRPNTARTVLAWSFDLVQPVQSPPTGKCCYVGV